MLSRLRLSAVSVRASRNVPITRALGSKSGHDEIGGATGSSTPVGLDKEADRQHMTEVDKQIEDALLKEKDVHSNVESPEHAKSAWDAKSNSPRDMEEEKMEQMKTQEMNAIFKEQVKLAKEGNLHGQGINFKYEGFKGEKELDDNNYTPILDEKNTNGSARFPHSANNLASTATKPDENEVRKQKMRGTSRDADTSGNKEQSREVDADINMKSSFDKMGGTNEEMRNNAAQTIQDPMDLAMDLAPGLGPITKETVKDTLDSAKDMSSQAMGTVKDATSHLTENVKHNVANVMHVASDATHTIKEQMSTVAEKVKTVSQSVLGTATTVTENVKGTLQGATDAMSGVGQNLKETVQATAQSASEMGKATAETASEASSAMKDLRHGVRETLGGNTLQDIRKATRGTMHDASVNMKGFTQDLRDVTRKSMEDLTEMAKGAMASGHPIPKPVDAEAAEKPEALTKDSQPTSKDPSKGKRFSERKQNASLL